MKSKIILQFILSTISGYMLFSFSKPLLANALIEKASTQHFEVDLKPGNNGYNQVISRNSDGKVHYLTNEDVPHSNPTSSDTTIAWMAQVDSQWQIFYYDMLSQKTIQLTFSGNNVNPKVSGKYIVWEGQNKGTWQIYLFNSIKISQLTESKNPKQGVDINGKYIAFSEKSSDQRGWRVVIYNLDSGEYLNPDQINYGAGVKINQERVIWTYFNENEHGLMEYNIKTKKLERLMGQITQEEDIPDHGLINSDEDPSVDEELYITDKDIRKEIEENESVEESTSSASFPDDISESTSSTD